MRILVTPRSFGNTDPTAFELLENAGFEIVKNETGGILDEQQLSKLINDCHGVILGVDPLNAEVLKNAPLLKAVAKYGVGVDNIDLEACAARNIEVTRTVGANSDAVADYAFALMLAVARKVVHIDSKCRKSDWGKTTTMDVYGKTLGLVGLGAIARGVAARAKGFGMNILAYDLFWDEEYAKAQGITKASLGEIYTQSDFISLHVPLTPETHMLIGAEEIEKMKPTAIIINTARGGIIDESAILAALQNNKIYGAGIDAFEQEPPKDPAWFALDNIILGSHCGASTTGATEQMGQMAARNIIKSLG
jgi:D-3-phosphoglycerate dehydrogenase